jgi:hypothetical protein
MRWIFVMFSKCSHSVKQKRSFSVPFRRGVSEVLDMTGFIG